MVHHLSYNVMGKVDSALGQAVEADSVTHTVLFTGYALVSLRVRKHS